jgi:hypothetical protein
MKINPAVLYAAAHNAGNAAVESATIQPMIVQQRANPLNDSSDLVKQYYVEDGVCGFASIVVKPATSSFAKYLKLNCGARKSYYGGIALSVQAFNQSLQKKEAYAYAFAKVLNEAGINAYVESRMD